MKRVVWIISEGSPGHVSQSEGLVASLSGRIDLEIHIIATRPRFGGFSRQLVRLWMGRQGKPLSDSFLKRWLGCEPHPSKPDLIVTSGGKAVFTARSLALKYGAPLVFLGERKPYSSTWFHTVFTPSPFETDAHDVPIEMIPTGMSPGKVAAAANTWSERPQGNLWAMIIGGKSRSHDFTDADWLLLATRMNELAEKHDIRWLISTSRRTGADAEGVLRKQLDPQSIARAVWWAEKPEKLMSPFLGCAEWIFVTQDSVTMVTEAVASGRPVVVTMPARISLKPTNFLTGYFNRLEKAARLVRIPIEKLADFHPDGIVIQPRLEPVNSELATTLLSRLHWPATH
jgi:mitochondrial fission protein ELM1